MPCIEVNKKSRSTLAGRSVSKLECKSPKQKLQIIVPGLWCILACVVLVGCSSERVDTKPKLPARNTQLTGDWYDEYERERTSRRPNPEDRALFGKPRECLIAAKRALSKKNYERAYELAAAVLKLEPRNAEAHFVRGAGIFYSAFGEEGEAIQDLETARDLGYSSTELFTVLAKLYDARKDYKNAIEAASYGLRVCPDKDLLRCRASLLLTVGKRNEALADLNRFVLIAPDKSMGYYMRANLLQQMGRYDDALRDLEICNVNDPDNTIALTERAKLFLRLGRHKEALAEISKVAEHDKSDDDALRLRGDIHAKLNQNELAIRDYTQAIGISPEYARAALEARAKVYARLGKKDLAARDFAEASKLKAKPAEKPIYHLN